MKMEVNSTQKLKASFRLCLCGKGLNIAIGLLVGEGRNTNLFTKWQRHLHDWFSGFGIDLKTL